MKNQIEALRLRFAEESGKVTSQDELETLRVAFLGKKGEVTNLLKNLRDVQNEEKKEAGQLINTLKTEVAQHRIDIYPGKTCLQCIHRYLPHFFAEFPFYF